jgi:translation initiation factor 3 subunit M
MAGPVNTLLIDGSFEELVNELATYIDNLKNAGDTTLATEIAPLLEQSKKDDVLKKLVLASAALHNAPEKGEQICVFSES